MGLTILGLTVYSLDKLILAIEIILFVRAILSWIPESDNSRFGQIIYKLTEPLLIPFRKLVSRSSVLDNVFIDVSFIVAILVLEIARRFLQSIILS